MEATLELLGTGVGIAYLWLEYRASIYLWVAGIIMPAIYIFVYYHAGLYADVAINIYFLLAALYGLACWMRGHDTAHTKPALPIAHTPRRVLPTLTLVTALAWVGIARLLTELTDSNVPWSDAFTTALSIVGMWMLARKYVEQWLVWIAVDVASALLYAYKELYFTSGLYAIYAVVAWFGYRKWLQLMNQETHDTSL
ncbi:MAG: nicotinamide riboside transporter PnuC [Bacteroides sp.]|nr:nicotinamide riboside transporter PnuC [Bacteroides sp.]